MGSCSIFDGLALDLVEEVRSIETESWVGEFPDLILIVL